MVEPGFGLEGLWLSKEYTMLQEHRSKSALFPDPMGYGQEDRSILANSVSGSTPS